jgi:hypothetical protein
MNLFNVPVLGVFACFDFIEVLDVAGFNFS